MADLPALFESYLLAGSPLAYGAAFAAGVMTSFTPCVYPALPVTVGYIGSRSRGSTRRGLVLSLGYVGGMAAVYAVLGAAAALTGKLFGTVAASPWTQLFLAGVCAVLGLSVFDLFAIRMPGFLSGAVGGPRPGAGGAFLAGAASGLVVGPCTAPVLGALLVYVGSHGNVFFGTSLMFAFALGMGALLVLFGTFSGLLASLPRSGPWLAVVKRGFGAALLLAAGYFLVRAGTLLF